jgi:5-methylthioadenosine/S-adenosylhomocysteine deaminase
MKEVDLILSNAIVVTMDEEFRQFSNGAIAISFDEIVAIGETKNILNQFSSKDVVDCGGKTIIPGLINAHTHASMTLLRGLTDDQRLDVWLLGYMMPVEREFVSPDFCSLGTRIACAEMIRGGVTCFADMYYHEESVAKTIAEVGMRAICGQTVLKFPSPDAESYEDSLKSARSFIKTWKDHELVIPAIAPHSAYTTTEDILRECIELATEFDVPLHIHIAETAQEQEQWRVSHDMPVVPWLKKQGIFETKAIAAHCVHIDEGEIHTLEHANSGVSHNPSSNLKLSSGFAPVTQMLSSGLNVGIGTDGPASNNDLDMFEEMRLASFVAKAISGDPTVLPARTTFAMATIMGAKALHIDHLTGSIEVGKKADLAIVDLDALHTLPYFRRNPESIYSRLVYAAKSADVTDVMVNGKWLMVDRALETIDEAPMIAAVEEYAKRIDNFLVKREGSVLSKLIAIGEAIQEESYEVQIKVRLPDPSSVIERLETLDLEIIRTAHYLEYDTYFSFADRGQGRLRYREDEFVNKKGDVYNVRYRLTLTGPAAERAYPNFVLLSRSRFIAPATHSLRFYREYFNPESEIEITKDRLRWLVRFRGEEFFINIDQILKPEVEGSFLEVKSRTWSRRDAERKSELISELIGVLGISDPVPVEVEYPDLIAAM